MRTELPAGTVLCFPDGGTFELLGVMGGGGQALIYEAREKDTQLYAAIKEIYPIRGCRRAAGEVMPEGKRAAAMLEKLKRSAEERENLLSQLAGRKNYQVLHGRGICHRAELCLPGESERAEVRNTYVRMDSLREKGVTLGAYIRRCRENGGITADTALAVMRTVLDAYAALHEDGFLHGDCQTGNLFLLKAGEAEGPGTACIIDFGSARRLSDDGATEEIRDEIYSTDGFCPPELLLRGRDPIRLTAACDVWALGVLLLEMLTGRVLQGEEITCFLMTHPREKRLYPDEAETLGLGPAEWDLLNGILKKALDNDPQMRYPNAGAMREDLRRLERCRRLDLSAGVDRHLLWAASCRFAERNASLFRTEHIPVLVERLPVKKLTVYASLNGEGVFPAAELLRNIALDEPLWKSDVPDKANSCFGVEGIDLSWLDVLRGDFEQPLSRSEPAEKNNRNVYLHAPGGAGKSYAAAELFNEFLETGRLVPLYLDLARFTENAVRVAGDAEAVIPRLLAGQLLEQDGAAEELAALLSAQTEGPPRYYLVLDNLHKTEKTVYPQVLAAVNHISRCWHNTRLLVVGRAEDPVRGEAAEPAEAVQEFHPACYVAMELLPEWDIEKLTETVFTERAKRLPEDSPQRRFSSLDVWHSSDERSAHRDTLGLPLFFMRYLEVICLEPEELSLPRGAAELLAVYFGQREYDANGRSVHEFLYKHMPWVAYQYMRSGRPVHTRQEIDGWLRESYGRLRYHPEQLEAFLYDAVENLALLTPAGENGLRFVHDCYQEYFSAAAIAGHIRRALEENDPRRCRGVNHVWPEPVSSMWLTLCVCEVTKGQVRRLCSREELLDELYSCLASDLPAAAEGADHIPGNIRKLPAEGGLHEFGWRWQVLQARMGDLEAQYHVGCRWENDRNAAEEERRQGKEWLRQSAEGGYAPAQYHLGLYSTGVESVRWLLAAAEQGVSDAQCMLGLAYLEGNGVERDVRQAERWYRAAAERGDTDAQYLLGVLYLHELDEPEKAAHALSAAAEHGNEAAMFRLGTLYEEGKGVPQDLETARKWYEKVSTGQLDPEQHLRRHLLKIRMEGITEKTSAERKLVVIELAIHTELGFETKQKEERIYWMFEWECLRLRRLKTTGDITAAAVVGRELLHIFALYVKQCPEAAARIYEKHTSDSLLMELLKNNGDFAEEAEGNCGQT